MFLNITWPFHKKRTLPKINTESEKKKNMEMEKHRHTRTHTHTHTHKTPFSGKLPAVGFLGGLIFETLKVYKPT